ncbi:MAG: RNHCP domain-containing protein [Candidatus Falkowbacteria bacterium]
MCKKFIKKIENFVCEKCGAVAKGNGYTDHCPRCLWSKHVDINPGDRANLCKGMMQPIGVETTNNVYVIQYKCELCKAEHRVKSAAGDNFEEILKLF